ncbi:MAG: NADH-quinone oxidoreductase subunit J [Candidatus Eisenbacteria bacterium]|nr:NADH-quinone oxidoreductase subunit J [Candidatus Eisenbacteria bacterium]
MEPFFYLFSFFAIVSAILAVTLKNIFHCALSLVVVFVSTSALFVLLDADFLAMVQVLIYVGAIIVLIIFAIVLTEKISGEKVKQTNEQRGASMFIALCLAGLVILAIFGSVLPLVPTAPRNDSLWAIGRELMTTYLGPFELISLVLLAALVGAVVFGKEVLKR